MCLQLKPSYPHPEPLWQIPEKQDLLLLPKSALLLLNLLQDPCRDFDSLNSFSKVILFTTKAVAAPMRSPLSTSFLVSPWQRLPMGVPPPLTERKTLTDLSLGSSDKMLSSLLCQGLLFLKKFR